MDANTSPLSSDHSIPSPAAEYKGSGVKNVNKPVRIATEPTHRGRGGLTGESRTRPEKK